ncbi:MAG: ComF family protein [Chitinophagaceae bacterium]|nr:ComF family protein [Chitinophagaceae bacterium]
MFAISEVGHSLFHLLFPQVCTGCGGDLPFTETTLCLRCLDSLPDTRFEFHPDNPVEKKFWGRLPLSGATASYYFTSESLIQHLMHEFKYRGNKELGRQLGRMMGNHIQSSGRFDVDALLPLPLFLSRQKKRGFNQAEILCQGIAEILKIPIMTSAIARTHSTDSQTNKGRIERWKNMEGNFIILDNELISGKHLLLVDDVITTGATLEACGAEMLKGRDVRLSIATLCFAAR